MTSAPLYCPRCGINLWENPEVRTVPCPFPLLSLTSVTCDCGLSQLVSDACLADARTPPVPFVPTRPWWLI